MTLAVAPKESLFTTSSGYTNYRGIFNLCVILLVLSNARAALENIMKYGILVDPISWITFVIDSPKHWPALEICLFVNGHIMMALIIERLIASGLIPKASFSGSYLALSMIVANLLTLLFLPTWIVFSYDSHPVTTSLALMIVSCTFLKLVSYHSHNFWCRDVKRPLKEQSCTTGAFLKTYSTPASEFAQLQQHRQPINGTQASSGTLSPSASSSAASSGGGGGCHKHQSGEMESNMAPVPSSPSLDKTYHQEDCIGKLYNDCSHPYPTNLTVKNIYYFMVAPTLCYELEFARTARIRKHFLLKRTIELVMLSQLDLALIQQWIVPTVENSLVPFRQMQFTHMLERLLKLAIPNHVIWLIWFYFYFHSWLNIQAELTQFADREFYRDWWNAESVNYFWRNWNIPVHKWCARHLYVPLLAYGWSRYAASAAVFLVSAFFHEYLVSVPLKMFRCWAFFGMLMQLPWARFVSTYFNHQFANVAVWITLIIGQPLCILMYYHDYYVLNK